MLGRSDVSYLSQDLVFVQLSDGWLFFVQGVLNPQGVRFGSAELYAVVEEMKDEIEDCLA